MDIAIGPIVEVSKVSIPPCLRHLGYLVHYKRNVNELRNHMARLGEVKTDVQRSVDAARSRGEMIKEVVEGWLARVDVTQNEVMQLYDAIQEDKGCLQGGCRARYHVGKEAARKIDVVNNFQREGQFDAVSIPPPPPQGIESMSTLDFQVYEPTKLAMKQILEALEDKKLNLVGVYGMGGVGKTTLMKEMAKELKNRGLFDRVVMVTVSQNPILKEIQREIAENLGFKIDEETPSVRAGRLLVRTKQEKRILIILDDLWELLPFREVGIPYGDSDNKGSDGSGCNCSIIITTRSLEVCNQMDTQNNVEVKPLGEEDAWQLFTRSGACDCVNSPELHEVGREIVRRCGGLPVALVTVGRALRDKDQKVWLDAATQLKKSIPSTIPGMKSGVLSSIKLSYDYLESEETKHCFLLCCLFPEDYTIYEDDLLPYVCGEKVFKDIETINETKNRLHTVLDTLKRSCLLLNVVKRSSLHGSRREGVTMHDIVRDVAIWIASQERGFIVKAGRGLREWPDMENLRKCKRLSLMQNKIRKLPEQMGCFQLMTLSLRNNHPFLEIPDRCFEGMTKLKVLDLRNVSIHSIPLSLSGLTELQVLHLGTGISFSWRRRRPLDASLLGNLKKLEILNLEGCYISTLPEEIGGLTNLKYLNLARNHKLIIPSNLLSRLSRLEELNLNGSFDRWEAKGSEDRSRACLSEVASLAHLTKLWVNVSNVECLSSFIPLHWDNLTDFIIFLGNYQKSRVIPWMDQPRDATKMIFHGFTIPKLSKWVEELLGRTEELLLRRCHGLTNIFPGLSGKSGLNNLRYIAVEECRDVEHILSAEVEEVPIIAFNKLEELDLDDVPDLREIWHGPFLKGSLENLRCLYIRCCHSLKHIFQMNMVQGLPQLEEIKIWFCSALEEIVMKNEGENAAGKVVVMFPRLRVLQLVELPNLSTVCQGVVSLLLDFPVIQRLCIYRCPNLKRLPLSLGSTPRLREIEVEETWFNDLEWDEPSEKLHLQENVKVNFLSQQPAWWVSV